MQSTSILLRQSLRSSIHITRTTFRTVQPQFRPIDPSTSPVRPRPTARSFSVCLRCQFRRQQGFLSPQDEVGKASDDAERLAQAARETPDAGFIPEGDAAASRAANTSAEAGEHLKGQSDEGRTVGQEELEGKEHSVGTASAQSGGLPSYLESRRSKLSKQFTTMMDNIQSNVFVAGQRLNDLTGYSGIEALKREIHSQGKGTIFHYAQHQSRTNTHSSIRKPPPRRQSPSPQSQRRLHSGHKPPLNLPARSQRAAPA